MRPTEIGLKIPRDKTPAGYFPSSTWDGRSLSVPSKKKRSTLPQARRFVQYDHEFRKTGYRVGPGHYNIGIHDISHCRAQGVAVYTKPHGKRDFSNNGYYFVGNHVVYEPCFTKLHKDDCSMTVDASNALRPETAKSKSLLKRRSKKAASSSKHIRNSPFIERVASLRKRIKKAKT